MIRECSKSEVQLCLAAKNIRKPSFTKDDLHTFGEMAFQNELQDWSAILESFCRLNFLRADGTTYTLTAEGENHIERVISSEFFGKTMVRAEQSRAFGRFCQRVYGKNLTQFGTADMEQLDKLLFVLALNKSSRVLDVGCGIGATAEYISDLTGAQITGIDLAEPVINRARERTREKVERLTFLLADINNLNLPSESFDTVISVDTLYFVKDLAKTMRHLKTVLKHGGQMGLFYSETVTAPTGSREQLAADRTKLAMALKANNLSFTTYDFTDSNLAFWHRSQRIATEMKSEFEAEGNKDLNEGRIVEGASVLELAKVGRMTRYLYHARVS